MIKVVCGVLIENKSVLMAQRAESMAHPLQWEFPGGKLDGDETAEEALKRELKEELSVQIHVNLALQPVIWKYPGKPEIQLLPLLCTKIKGELKPLEHRQLKWCSRNDLKKLDILDADIAIINQIEKLL